MKSMYKIGDCYEVSGGASAMNLGNMKYMFDIIRVYDDYFKNNCDSFRLALII